MTNTMRRTARKPLALGAAAVALAGTFALSATTPANAAPFSISQTAVKEAAPDNVIDVHRRRYRGHAIAGLALGIVGTALAYKYHRDHHRHYYHGGYYPYYGYGYRHGYGCHRVHNHRNSVVSWRCR